MQENAFMRNGSSIHESNTHGYQTSYVHHMENPVHFTKEIKVTIEHGHGNHLCNEMSSTAYWYAAAPAAAATPPSVRQRLPIRRDSMGAWLYDDSIRVTSRIVPLNAEMKKMRRQARAKGKLLKVDEGNRPRLTGRRRSGRHR
jgi:hypothetical protein